MSSEPIRRLNLLCILQRAHAYCICLSTRCHFQNSGHDCLNIMTCCPVCSREGSAGGGPEASVEGRVSHYHAGEVPSGGGQNIRLQVCQVISGTSTWILWRKNKTWCVFVISYFPDSLLTSVGQALVNIFKPEVSCLIYICSCILSLTLSGLLFLIPFLVYIFLCCRTRRHKGITFVGSGGGVSGGVRISLYGA